MSNFVNKILNAMKLNDTTDDEMDVEIEDRIEETTVQNIRPARREVKQETERYERPSRNSENRENKSSLTAYNNKPQTNTQPRTNVVNFHASVQMEVVVIQPGTYDEAQVIADHIRSQRPVIVNLEKMDYSIAQRIMDFVSGAVYTLGGNLERVTQNIFIIAPENVDIAGHFQEELKSNGIILPWKSE